MRADLTVHLFRLTGRATSQHVYLDNLRAALADLGVEHVADPTAADVVHLVEFNLLSSDALRRFRYPTLLRLLAGGTPVVLSIDDLFFIDHPEFTAVPRLYGLNARLQRRLMGRADAVVTFSESAKRNLPVVGPEPHVVPHGVDPSYYAETVGPSVLHVSFAAKVKNPDAVVRVARETDAEFHVVGGGWPDVIPPAVQARPNVHVTGYTTPAGLVEHYREAGVFYYPTLHESFGLPVLEAMAASCAVVGTDRGAVPEVLGGTGVTVAPHDVDAHLDAIAGLVADSERRERLARAAHERAREFTWARAARETRAVYDSLLG